MNARVKALENLFRRGKITKEGLKQAVTDGVITQDEFKKIVGEDG